jgi:hypothetical protein
MRLLLTVVAAYPHGRFNGSYFAQPPQASSGRRRWADRVWVRRAVLSNAMVLVNAVASVQPGYVLDCVAPRTWQTGRSG